MDKFATGVMRPQFTQAEVAESLRSAAEQFVGKQFDPKKVVDLDRFKKAYTKAQESGYKGNDMDYANQLTQEGYVVKSFGDYQRSVAQTEAKKQESQIVSKAAEEEVKKNKTRYERVNDPIESTVKNFLGGVVFRAPEMVADASKLGANLLDKSIGGIIGAVARQLGVPEESAFMKEFTRGGEISEEDQTLEKLLLMGQTKEETQEELGVDKESLATKAGEFVTDLAATVLLTRGAGPGITKAPGVVQLVSKYPWMKNVIGLGFEGAAEGAAYGLVTEGEIDPLEVGLGTVGGVAIGAGKNALKLISGGDPTKMLTQAIRPRIASLSKNKSATTALANVEEAGKLVAKYADDLPTNTATQVAAWKQAMGRIWDQVEAKLDDGVSEGLKIKGDDIASVIDDYLAKNPALDTIDSSGVKKIKEMAEGLRRVGPQDVNYWENAKQIYNALSDFDNVDISKTVKNVYKELSTAIGGQLDDKLSSVPGDFADLKREYGTLRSLYDDVWKSDVIQQRKAGKGIYETFGRIQGMSDIMNGIGGFVSGQGSVSKALEGVTKVILGKYSQKLSDPDYLIEAAYKKIADGLQSSL